MREGSKPPPAARQFEHLRAPTGHATAGGAKTLNAFFYCLEGVPGIFRRVVRVGRTAKPSYHDSIVAYYNGSLIELARDTKAEKELADADLAAMDPLAAVEVELARAHRAGRDGKLLQEALDCLEAYARQAREQAASSSSTPAEDDEAAAGDGEAAGEPEAAAEPMTAEELLRRQRSGDD